jgi:hypothetical protein
VLGAYSEMKKMDVGGFRPTRLPRQLPRQLPYGGGWGRGASSSGAAAGGSGSGDKSVSLAEERYTDYESRRRMAHLAHKGGAGMNAVGGKMLPEDLPPLPPGIEEAFFEEPKRKGEQME